MFRNESIEQDKLAHVANPWKFNQTWIIPGGNL